MLASFPKTIARHDENTEMIRRRITDNHPCTIPSALDRFSQPPSASRPLFSRIRPVCAVTMAESPAMMTVEIAMPPDCAYSSAVLDTPSRGWRRCGDRLLAIIQLSLRTLAITINHSLLGQCGPLRLDCQHQRDPGSPLNRGVLFQSRHVPVSLLLPALRHELFF